MASRGPRSPAGPTEPVFELAKAEDQLVEIARAEAVLNKRDPEQAAQVVRAQLVHQDSEVGRLERAAKIEVAAARGERARRMRRIKLAVALGILAAAAVPVTRALLREKDRVDALSARLDALGRPAARSGFREAGRWLDVPRSGVTFQVPRDTCSALVAAREGEGAPALEIERQGAPRTTASGGVLLCSCQAEKITVTLSDGGGARQALGWMSAPGTAAGGIHVLAARPADGFQLVSDPAALGCADADFQGWAEREGHGDLDPLDATRPGPAADLVAEGFEPVGLFAAERPFAVIRARQGRCYVAAPEPGSSEITLRGPDAARLVAGAGGAVVWCSHAADAVFSLWHAETGSRRVAVLGAPADRTGGIMGAVLSVRRRGTRSVESALLPDELAKDARALLVAATVPAASIQEADVTGLPGKPESRVVAFSLRGKVAMLPEVAPAVPTACLPDPDAAQPPTAFLCAEARAQVWHRGGDAQHQGAVEGARPYWLGVLEGAGEEGAVRAAAALLVFAQRMSLLGYEPTTSEGVKDTPGGAVISGGGGRGEVVAVGISRAKPWVSPLTDGPSWSLTGPLRVVQIPPGATKTLRSEARLAEGVKDRRVVVWRR